MVIYCENCEDYQEEENGRCSVCGLRLVSRKRKANLDSWSEEDEFEIEED